MLNNRELASLILITALVVIVVASPKWRSLALPSAGEVARAFLKWAILRIFGLFVLWTALWVWLGWLIGIWEPELLKDTIILFFGVGFPLLFNSTRANSGAEIFGHVRRETLTLSALFLFYLNLETLPLWAELIVQPVTVLLTVMIALAQRDEKGGRILGCFSIPLLLIGLGLVAWTTGQTIANWGQIDGRQLLLQLALSVWLPFTMFPYLYGVAFYSATEVILKRLVWANKEMPIRARLGVLAGLHLSVRWANALTGRYYDVSQAKTFRASISAMRDFRDDVRHRASREADRLADLKGFAGQTGADGTGAQLDRREFDGTKRALRWIHTAQALRYERLGEQFWDDLTHMVISPTSRWDLPAQHGISVETTKDRKKWRAWRRMPSGWVLGIGGTGRFGEYLYSGPQLPTTWPGASDQWVDSGGSVGSADWERKDGPRL